MTFTKGQSGNPSGKRPGLSKIERQAQIYAATLRDQLSLDGFTFADKIQEVWADIKTIEKTPPGQTEEGRPYWSPLDVVKLKLKYLDTIAGYLYPRLGQVEVKAGMKVFAPTIYNVNMPAAEKALALERVAAQLKRDPAQLTQAESEELDNSSPF